MYIHNKNNKMQCRYVIHAYVIHKTLLLKLFSLFNININFNILIRLTL